MNTFPLKIVTPEGLIYDGEAREIIVRATGGDMAVMAGHINCVAPLGTGRTTLVDAAGSRRDATCHGGLLSVLNGRVTLIPSMFQWADSGQRP